MLARINRNYVPAYWDDFFNDSFFNDLATTGCNTQVPAVNVSEDEKGYHIEVAAPGVARKEFKLEINDDILSISTEEKENKKDSRPNYLRSEFNFRSFTRNFRLPDSVNRDEIKASHESGVLTVTLPKKEEIVQNAHRRIEVKCIKFLYHPL